MNYTASPDLLSDRIILVTGAGSGIGRQAALSYAAHGATVLLLGRTVTNLERCYDEIIKANCPEPAIIPLDLTDLTHPGSESLVGLKASITEKYGRLDGLLHNAAILGERVPFEHYNLAQWAGVMQVNFNAAVILTQALLGLLKKSDAASLIFTSSGVGATPRAYWGAYSVSKYALEGFAKLLSDELTTTSSVRVNILNPGATRTAMRAAAFPAENPLSLKSAEQLMSLYLYLMGDDSKSEHGKTFNATAV